MAILGVGGVTYYPSNIQFYLKPAVGFPKRLGR